MPEEFREYALQFWFRGLGSKVASLGVCDVELKP